MRALHLVKTSVGASWALRQMRELVKLGVEVHVILPPGGPRFPEYQQAGVVTHPGNVDFSVRSAQQRRSAARLLRRVVGEVSPDIIHSHFVGTTLTMRLALGKRHPIPRVFQVPGPLHLEHALYRRAEIATSGPSDHWIGSCRWTCARYRSLGIATHRIFLAYYGGDIGEFECPPSGQLRSELGLPSDVPIIGMVAFMYAPKWYLGHKRGLKGHEDLIDAMAIVRETQPDAICVMVGGAWNGATRYESRVRAYADRNCPKGIVFLGTRHDVPLLYPDFTVAVHPSHSENVGGAAESLLYGIPTIATDVGGFPDVVQPGRTGMLVKPKSPPALAEAILLALADMDASATLARAGRRLVQDTLDVRNNARQVYSAYDTILRRTKIPRFHSAMVQR